jgi:hypothetical protein
MKIKHLANSAPVASSGSNFGAPTFVAEFVDGAITRMTTHCSPDELDLARGIALAKAAYTVRTKQTPPPLISAHFEVPSGGAVLQVYGADELNGGGNV